MAFAQVAQRAKLRLMERFFPDASEAQAETFEILMDLDQATDLFAGLDEMRRGRVVTMADAFADI